MNNDRSATVVRGACHHDCPDTCVWNVTVQDGRAVALHGNRDHPTTAGQLCPKVNRLLDRVYHQDRLTTPLRRVGPKGSGSFEPIGWNDAIASIAERLTALCDGPGAESILQYSFAGTQGMVQKGVMADRFFAALGASDIKRHLCGVTARIGAAEVLGTPMGFDPQDIAMAQTILLWGTNTYLTNRHLWPFIEQARANGAVVVVIDPVATATAQKADELFQLKPGSDVALVLGMVNILIAEDLVDHDWIHSNTTGWDDLRSAALTMPVERAGRITGIDPLRIVWLARTYAARQPSAIRTLVGPEHRKQGRDIMAAITMLPAVVGAWRHSGGGLARSTSVYFEEALNVVAPEGPARRSFNMARLGEILTDKGLHPTIQALVVHNSNPAVIAPDQNRVIEGLEREDLFTVTIDQFLTDTARYSDIVLPATTQLEHLDLADSWGHLYLALNKPAIEPVGQSLPNTEIFRRLANAMGMDDPVFAATDEDVVRELLDSAHPLMDGITFETLERDGWARLNIPHGHRPYLRAGVEDRPKMRLRAVEYRPGDEVPGRGASAWPLQLLSPKQHTKFLNANYGGFPEHHPQAGQPVVSLHPTDAQARGIVAGDEVRVHNDRGSLTLEAVVDPALLERTVSIPFGWWHAATPEGRSVNVLTNATVPDDDIGSAFFLETLVEVTRAE